MPHRIAAKAWFDSISETTSCAFCRNTEMALLRLLTNRTVMGDMVCTQRLAWVLYESLRSKEAVVFLDEPPGVDAAFRRISSRDEISPNRWQDDYLAAFAEVGDLTLVTFDRALAARVPGVTLLTP
jgi:toxin-antitoxin system PIN domain toxin